MVYERIAGPESGWSRAGVIRREVLPEVVYMLAPMYRPDHSTEWSLDLQIERVVAAICRLSLQSADWGRLSIESVDCVRYPRPRSPISGSADSRVGSGGGGARFTKCWQHVGEFRESPNE